MHQVQRLNPGDAASAARWDGFVQGCAEAGFFHRSGWQGLLREVFGHDTHYLYAEREGRIEAVLPLAHVKSWLFGSSLVSLPFASIAGVAASDEAARAALVARAQQLAAQLDVEFLELRNEDAQPGGWPTQDLYVAFRMPLPAVLDEKMLCIPQKRRNMVRKAAKLGLHAVVDDSVEHFFPVFATNSRDHGTPAMPRRWFERLRTTFGSDCGILSVADATGRRVSSILCFFHRGTVMAYYAGELPEARQMAANDLKYWEVMRWAAGRGCTVFDIGRSKRGTGSFDFKKLWGFEAHPLHYQYDLRRRDAVPQNNPTNPKYRLLIKTWQRLPLPVANTIGPWVVRALG